MDGCVAAASVTYTPCRALLLAVVMWQFSSFFKDVDVDLVIFHSIKVYLSDDTERV